MQRTAAHFLAQNGSVEAVRLLLAHGDVNLTLRDVSPVCRMTSFLDYRGFYWAYKTACDVATTANFPELAQLLRAE